MSSAIPVKITIVTVCKNSEKYIEETINSVLNQSYPNIEYIIVDGESTDGTINIIKKYEARITKWVSEADGSMYEAINKALLMATGTYAMVLNSDDVLADKNVISKVAAEINKKNLDYYYGNIIKRKNDKEKKTRMFTVNYLMLLLSKHAGFIPHPCLFISLKTHHAIGGYNTKFKYSSDFDYILRMLKLKGVTGKHVSVYTTKFRMHDESITASGKLIADGRAVLEEHNYFSISPVIRFLGYYPQWIFYKIINLNHSYLPPAAN